MAFNWGVSVHFDSAMTRVQTSLETTRFYLHSTSPGSFSTGKTSKKETGFIVLKTFIITSEGLNLVLLAIFSPYADWLMSVRRRGSSLCSKFSRKSGCTPLAPTEKKSHQALNMSRPVVLICRGEKYLSLGSDEEVSLKGSCHHAHMLRTPDTAHINHTVRSVWAGTLQHIMECKINLLVREAVFGDLVSCKPSLDDPWTLQEGERWDVWASHG